jgi:hypothetical protein
MTRDVSIPGLAPDALTTGRPVILAGDALARGRRQALAEPDSRPAVFEAVMGRLDSGRGALSRAADHLAAQWTFVGKRAPGQLAQVRGVAEGYGIKARDLFAYLHLGLIEDAEGQALTEEDGCSVVACRARGTGPVLAKNRDYRGEHRALQRVFLESDPAWGGRRILSIGSLGSPGAFSSGMNSDGLALADTRIGWRRPGVGWLRYLLMNEILIRAGTVLEALSFIESQPHAGGGSLVLMDAAGHGATVELGAGRLRSQTAGRAGIGHTNHFLDPDLWAGQTRSPGDPQASNSRGRLARIENWIEVSRTQPPALQDLAALMASHVQDDRPALCRHGGTDGSETISTTVFACTSRRLYSCPGNPCTDDWRLYAF